MRITGHRIPRLLTALLAVVGIAGATTLATAAPAQAVAASKIFEIAKGEIGTLEGSAADKYFSQPGLGKHSTASTSWCAAFVTWVSWMAGASTFKSASVDAWVKAGKNKTGGLALTSSPRAGDLVAFQWKTHDGTEGWEWDHLGIVTSVGDGYYYTIEGNTSDPNGKTSKDGVFAKKRSPSQAKKVQYIKLAS